MVSREVFIKLTINKFVDYIERNFDNKDLNQEISKYKDIDIILLILWWRENMRCVDDFINDIVKRYNLTLSEEQHNKISLYLEVLNI